MLPQSEHQIGKEGDWSDTEHAPKKRKYPMNGSCVEENICWSQRSHGRPASSSAAFPHRGCAPQKQNTRHIAGKLWWKWNHMKQVMKKLSMMTSCRTQLLLAGHWHGFELDILLSGPHLRLLILPPSLNTVSRSNLRTWSLNLHSYKPAHCVSV